MTNDTDPLYHAGIGICFDDRSNTGIICARAVTFSLLAFVTFILCLLKVVQIQRGLTIERYHLAVFYLATIETLILFLHWVYLSEIALHFVALYLHVNQFLLIAVFYGRLAARILRPTPRTNRLFNYAAGLTFLYFTAVLIYALSDVVANAVECRQPPWLLFSASKLVLAQLLAFAGYHLHKAIEEANTESSYKRLKKRTLYGLIGAFEVAALSNFLSDIIFFALSPGRGCDGVFGSPRSASYTAALLILRFLTHLLPIWALLYLLRPAARRITPQGNMTSHFADQAASTSDGSQPPLLFDGYDLDEDEAPSGMVNSLGEPLLRPADNYGGPVDDEW